MKTLSPFGFTQVNRHILRMPKVPPVHEQPTCMRPMYPMVNSLLGYIGTNEARFVQSWVEWAQADGTTYQ